MVALGLMIGWGALGVVLIPFFASIGALIGLLTYVLRQQLIGMAVIFAAIDLVRGWPVAAALIRWIVHWTSGGDLFR